MYTSIRNFPRALNDQVNLMAAELTVKHGRKVTREELIPILIRCGMLDAEGITDAIERNNKR
jgi:hypothetical protein